MEAVHLCATDLAFYTGRFQNLCGLRLLYTIFVHLAEYTGKAHTRHRRL